MTYLIVLVVILSAFTFNQAFNFHLYLDDWHQIIGSLYYPEILAGDYIRLHPVSVLEFKLLSPLFKFNPYPWQLVGFLLKIIDSLSLYPLMMALTNSKKTAFYASLFFAVSVIGIESVTWVSPHSSAIVIPLLSLGSYFWIKSEQLKSVRQIFYALILFALAMLAEPGRASMIIFLVLVWELMSLYQNFNIKIIYKSFLRIIILFLPVLFVSFIAYNFFGTSANLAQLFKSLTAINFVTVTQFLERPLFGWTLLPEQSAFWATALFAGLMFFIILLFFWKKQQPFKIIIFLFLWIAIFYLPNFLTQSFTKSGIPMESRYYAISAVGLAGLLAFGFSFIKTRYLNQIILGFLIFNIYVVNQSLIKDSTFRSINVYNKIWDKIDRDVPKDEKNSIFMYTGADYSLRTRLLDWQDSIPFAIKRGITKKEDYPIVTNDKNLIAKLICERNILRHSPFGDLMQKEPIPLSHVHAWELKNGELVDRSEEERRGITAKCLVDQKR